MATVALGNLFPPVISLISGPILAQALGVEGRGLVAAATAPFALVVALVTFGVPEAVMYTVAKHPGLVRQVLRRALMLLVGSGTLATGLVVAASPLLSAGNESVRFLMLVAAAAIVPNIAVGALRGVAIGLGRWRTVTTERALSSIAKLVLLVPFWLTGNLTPLVATVVIAALPVLGSAPYFLMLRRLPPVSTESGPTGAIALLSYGSRLWAGSLAGILLMRVDQTLVAPLAGTEELGLYVVAVAVSELPLIFISAVREVTFVAEASGAENQRLATTARVSTLLCAAIALCIGVTMAWWVPLLFGEGFAGAVPVAAVLLVAVVVGVPGSVAGSGLTARGRPGLRSWSLVVACVVNVAAVVLLVPPLGAVGAALATLVGLATSGTLNIVFARRYLGIPAAPFYGLRRGDLRLVVTSARRLLRRR